MKSIQLKSDPIWDFLADSIRIGESQTKTLADSHPAAKSNLERRHLNDTITRLTQMLILDSRRTNTWLKDQTPTTQRAAVFAKQNTTRAVRHMSNAKKLLQVHTTKTRKLPQVIVW
jgi:hypothetical protein